MERQEEGCGADCVATPILVREDGAEVEDPAYCLSRIAYAHKNARVS